MLSKNSKNQDDSIGGLSFVKFDKHIVLNCDRNAIARTIRAQYFRNSIANFICCNAGFGATGIIDDTKEN